MDADALTLIGGTRERIVPEVLEILPSPMAGQNDQTDWVVLRDVAREQLAR